MGNSANDKVVILAAGLGTRMRKMDEQAHLDADQAAIAETGVKALVPTGRPFLDYVLTALADAGYRRVCLVIGPEHDNLREYYGKTLTYERLSVEFAVQAEAIGTANAVASAREFCGDDLFLTINSDNYYPVESLRGLRELDQPGLAVYEREAMIAGSNIPADRITRFAVVETGDDGCMTRIIEKPSAEQVEAMPRPIGVSMNCWWFDARIFEACEKIDKSPRGEYEITDAAQYGIDRLGVKFKVLNYEAPVLDLTSRSDVEPVTQMLESKEVRI